MVAVFVNAAVAAASTSSLFSGLDKGDYAYREENYNYSDDDVVNHIFTPFLEKIYRFKVCGLI